MGIWDKVKDAAQKAADAAKDQVQREDSFLNKTVDAGKKAADKAVVVAKDQYYRQDSGLNKLKANAAGASDKLLGHIDAIDANKRDDHIAAARRYVVKRKSETAVDKDEVVDPGVDRPRDDDRERFPNSMEWTDEEVYSKVSETVYPDFKTLPAGDKKWALCEIARYDRRIVNLMRAIGSAYIDTVRQLAEQDDAWAAALEAAGLSRDPELSRAYRNWLDDAYDDAFYADDDGGHVKAVRLLGSLVFARLGAPGPKGEPAGDALRLAIDDCGVRDQYGLVKLIGTTRDLIDAREAVVLQAFKPRRAAFASDFLVHKGINADVQFTWLGPDGKPDGADDTATGGGGDGGDGGGFAGGSLMEL